MDYKEACEKGRIVGLYESGHSIDEIEKLVKWQRQDIEKVLKEENGSEGDSA